MKHKIQAAFDQVTAETALKEATEAYVLQHMAPKKISYQPLLAAFACLALVFIGGYWSLFTPTAEISLDINPSVVLNINRFDRVISVDSYNRDGEALLHSLDVKFLNYSDAVDKILASETVSGLLSQDETMTIAVTGQNSRQSQEILTNLQSSNTQDSVYCYYAESEEAAQAHHMGLSHPRYQAYLTLQEQGQPVDAADLNCMSMKEIHDLVSGHHEEASHPDNGHHAENSHQYSQESTQETASDNGNHHSSNSNQHHQNQHGNGHS